MHRIKDKYTTSFLVKMSFFFILIGLINVNLFSEEKWSYQGKKGPQNWAKLTEGSSCSAKSQSPVDIVIDTIKGGQSDTLDINYGSNGKIRNIVNNGHTIQYNVGKGNYVNYKGEKFELKQFHFHGAAEHTINGVRYPLEMHLVHASAKGELLVLGVMIEERGRTSAPFKFLQSYFPVKKGKVKKINKSFDFSFLIKQKKYFSYKGSLTTPPCSEGVNWFVFKEPIAISASQVNALTKLMPFNNYRPIQALNGRVIKQTK